METKNFNMDLLHLKEMRDNKWSNLLSQSKWANFITNEKFDIRFYAIYLLETYHYVTHNPKHQALVGVHTKSKNFKYIKFCYEHSEEETGHEMMAMHDILSLGMDKVDFEIPDPHPDTELFIAYLYWISTNGNSLQRLGYSFWAEDSYQYIGKLIEKVKTTLGLEKNQMTFLISHAAIDEKHAQEIDEMINEFCLTGNDWQSVKKVMNMTLDLQSRMLDSVLFEYINLIDGNESNYSFLNKLI